MKKIETFSVAMQISILVNSNELATILPFLTSDEYDNWYYSKVEHVDEHISYDLPDFEIAHVYDDYAFSEYENRYCGLYKITFSRCINGLTCDDMSRYVSGYRESFGQDIDGVLKYLEKKPA